MKKYFVLVILAVILGCKKDDPLPTACFTLSTTSAGIGETINASNCSTNATSYLWTDNDGGVSTLEDASFVYSDAGTYIITLKAYVGSNSDEETKTVTIIHKTGSVSFWQSGTPSYNTTVVRINGLSGNITSDRPNGITDCTSTGCANFILPTGTYAFTASDGTYNWSGNATIQAGQCLKIKLQ